MVMKGNSVIAFRHYGRSLKTYSVVNVLGGDERARTADPLLAKQVLSQLSYIPAYGLAAIPV